MVANLLLRLVGSYWFPVEPLYKPEVKCCFVNWPIIDTFHQSIDIFVSSGDEAFE